MTGDRGALSLATEPAYFAFAMILLSLAIVHLGGKYFYLLIGAAATILIAQSAVGLFYAVAVLFFYSPIRVDRKMLALAVALIVWFASIRLAPDSRMAWGSVQLLTDPARLITTDMSVGLRYINLEYPIRAFLQNGGWPHGLVNWAETLNQQFTLHGSAVRWRFALVDESESTGRILSIHGQLLFELGWFALIYYLLLWLVIKDSRHRLAFAAILVVMFLNGLTLNSPFLALMLAVAFVEPESQKAETMVDPPHPRSMRGLRAPAGQRTEGARRR